jgi:hypothetical protein
MHTQVKREIIHRRLSLLSQDGFNQLCYNIPMDVFDIATELIEAGRLPFIIPYQILSNNENMTIEYIAKYKDSNWNWGRIAYHPHIIENIEMYADLPWDWNSLSVNIPFSYFLDHADDPDIQINWSLIVINRRIPIEYILGSLHRHPWELSLIGTRANQMSFSMYLYHRNALPWSAYEAICTWATLEDIQSHPNFDWSYAHLSNNMNVNTDFIESTIDKGWDFNRLSYAITPDIGFLRRHVDKPWDWYHLSQDLDVHDIVTNSDLPWVWEALCSRGYYSTWRQVRRLLDFVILRPELPWDYEELSCNLGIPLPAIAERATQIPWEWEHVSGRLDLTLNFVNAHPGLPWARPFPNHVVETATNWEDAEKLLVRHDRSNYFVQVNAIDYITNGISDEVVERMRRWYAARKIQRAWMHHFYNPTSLICQRRLKRDFAMFSGDCTVSQSSKKHKSMFVGKL